MLKSIKFAALASAVVVAAGCHSFNTNKPSATLQPRLVTNELRADIKVGERVTGESNLNVLFGFIAFGGDSNFADGVGYDGITSGGLLGSNPLDKTPQVQAAAAYNALAPVNGDVLISPRYEITVDDFFVFKKIHVKVTGYKGTVNSITSTNNYNSQVINVQ